MASSQGRYGVSGAFYGLPLATIQALQTSYIACLTAIATGGQSYSISGRSFNRGSLEEVKAIIAELQSAIDRAQGTRPTQTYPMFTQSH